MARAKKKLMNRPDHFLNKFRYMKELSLPSIVCHVIVIMYRHIVSVILRKNLFLLLLFLISDSRQRVVTDVNLRQGRANRG